MSLTRLSERLRVSHRLLVAAAAAAGLTGAAAAPAAAQSVSASVTGYTGIGVGGGVIPPGDLHEITVVRHDGPLHAEASGAGGEDFVGVVTPPLVPTYTKAAVEGFAAADPGVLHVYAADRAIAQNGVNGPNLPPITNTNTVATQIQVSAAFSDDLTVHNSNLAFGAATQVPFRYVAEMFSTEPLGYPQFSVHPLSVFVSFVFEGFSPQNFSSELGLFFPNQYNPATGLYFNQIASSEFFVPAHVGDVLTISALFAISGQANITDSNRQDGNFGNVVDGRNTAGIWLGALPDGMTITSASGHDYTRDPRLPALPSAVPEPATWVVMLAGASGVGVMLRRRRAFAAAAT